MSVSLSPVVLRPANHRMVDVAATVVATDPCGGTTQISLTSITSSEPDDAPGIGDGNTINDIQGAQFGTADLAFRLRAERDGSGPGRTYTVTYSATGTAGQTASATALVTVPRAARDAISLQGSSRDVGRRDQKDRKGGGGPGANSGDD